MNLQAQLPIGYEFKEFTLDDGETDYDVKANITELFSDIITARSTIIKTTKNITMKINSTLFDSFPVDIGDTPWQFPPGYINITNLYLSNASGDTSTLKIWLFG